MIVSKILLLWYYLFKCQSLFCFLLIKLSAESWVLGNDVNVHLCKEYDFYGNYLMAVSESII